MVFFISLGGRSLSKVLAFVKAFIKTLVFLLLQSPTHESDICTPIFLDRKKENCATLTANNSPLARVIEIMDEILKI